MKHLSVSDVRDICKYLVANDGDVNKTAEKFSVPPDMVQRIKDKRYMAVVSDQYFSKSYYEKKYDKPSVDTSTINTEVLNNVFVAPAVENIIDDNNKNNQKEESVMNNNNNEDKTSKEEMIVEIANMIASGIDCATIRKKYTRLSARSVNEILRQKCYKAMTKSIFKFDQDNRVIISIKDGKEYPYNSYINTKKLTSSAKAKYDVVSDIEKPTTKIDEPKIVTPDEYFSDMIGKIVSEKIYNKPINQLPELLKEKVKTLIMSEIESMTIKDLMKL